MELGDLQAHLHPERRVEVRQRLVEQEGLGLAHDGAPDGHALALAAGELARLAVEIVRQIQHRGRLLHLLADGLLGHAGHLEAEADIAAHAHMGIERIGLEHHGEAALGGRQIADVDAVDLDPAAGRVLEPGDQPQQGRFAATRRPDEDDELAGLDLEVDRGNDDVLAEGLAARP